MNRKDDFNGDYKNSINCKYTLAKDDTYNNKPFKKYRGFQSIQELINFINTMKNSKYRIYYEVITNNTSKFYFDFDKLDIIKEEFNLYVSDFINNFNAFFNKSITIDDMLIYNRIDNNELNKISSIHFIIKNYNVSREIIKNFLDFLELKNLSIMPDKKVYSKNRLFNMPFNTKLKYLKDITNPKYFVSYKTQDDKAKDYLINYIENTEQIKIPFLTQSCMLIVNKCKKDRIELIKHSFNKWKTNLNLEQEKPNDLKYYCYDINDIIEYLCFNMPTKFYENEDCKTITYIFKKFHITNDNVDKWLKIYNINCNKFTISENTEWYNKLDTSNTIVGKPKLIEIVKKWLNIEIVFNYDERINEWLILKTGKEYDDCLKNDNNDKVKLFTNPNEIEYIYERSSGFLFCKNELIVYGTFNVEVLLKEYHEQSKTSNIIDVDDIKDMMPIVDEYNNIIKDVLIAKAKWGSGKTHFIIRKVINYAIENGLNIRIITENNALNQKISKDFDFVSHINNNNLSMEQKIVCSSESIRKINFCSNDILILDEFESLLNHFESDTHKNDALQNFLHLKNGIKNCNKIVILDADISLERVKLIKQIRDDKYSYKIYHIHTDNFKEYKFNYVINNKDLILHFKDNLKKDKKLIFASASKKLIEDIFLDTKNKINANEIKDKTLLIIDGGNTKLFKNKIEIDLDKNDTLLNLEDIILNNQVDIFLYSPTIKTGVSINTEYFDLTYAYGNNNTLCVREFIQMLFRARNIKDKMIYFSFNRKLGQIKPFITDKKIESYVKDPIILFKTQKIFDGEFNTDDIIGNSNYEIDDDYFKCKCINIKENYNSKTRYTQDFFLRMVYNHKIKINYINKTLLEDDDNENDDINDDTLDIFTETKLLTHIEYEEKTNNETIDWRERQKYKFFYHNYYIKGITDELILNPNIYDIINNPKFYLKYNNPAEKNINSNIKYLLNKKIDEIQEDNNDLLNNKFLNKLDGTEHKIGKNVIITNLINHLSLDLNIMPIMITNKELNTKLLNFKFTQFNISMKNYFDIYTHENPYIFDDRDPKQYIKNIKKPILVLLKEIGVNFKYTSDKHTTSDNDKIRFYFENYNTEPKKYIGRFINIEKRFKEKENEVKKFKNWFKTDNGIKLYKNETNFTTYEIKRSKKIKYLMERKIEPELYKNLYDYTLNNEMKVYLMNRYRPYIIERTKYSNVLQFEIDIS